MYTQPLFPFSDDTLKPTAVRDMGHQLYTLGSHSVLASIRGLQLSAVHTGSYNGLASMKGLQLSVVHIMALTVDPLPVLLMSSDGRLISGFLSLQKSSCSNYIHHVQS